MNNSHVWQEEEIYIDIYIERERGRAELVSIGCNPAALFKLSTVQTPVDSTQGASLLCLQWVDHTHPVLDGPRLRELLLRGRLWPPVTICARWVDQTHGSPTGARCCCLMERAVAVHSTLALCVCLMERLYIYITTATTTPAPAKASAKAAPHETYFFCLLLFNMLVFAHVLKENMET